MLDAYGLTLMGCQFQRESLIQNQPTKCPLHANLWFHQALVMAQGRFYKLALTDCETIFEFNLFVSEGV